MDVGQHTGVVRAVHMMREHLSEPLTINDLAEYAFFSKYHFTRVFQRYTGMPPGKFLAELRMMSAEHLLVTSDLSFTDITFRVGYASIGSFSSRFKVVLGLPPSEYRRRQCPAESPFSSAASSRACSVVVRDWLHTVETEIGPQETHLGGWSTAVPEHRLVSRIA
ncbi:MAG: helix-turn-helix domain-containing protein [Phycicoccus sp.]